MKLLCAVICCLLPAIPASAVEMRIPLLAGENRISINIDPIEMYSEGEDRGPDVVRMFEQFRQEDGGNLVGLVRDERGRTYSPAFGFNGIPYWNLSEAYWVRMQAEADLVLEGVPISPQHPIELAAGWNLVAYYPEYELPASRPDYYVLSSILERVIRAADPSGQYMAPRLGFSNMSPWYQGVGYEIVVDSACTLIYPRPLNAAVFPPFIHQPAFVGLSSFPNPFNSSTTITYSLPKPGRYALEVVDISGRVWRS